MAGFKEGDRVQIADREATAEDIKSGLFYNHFRGLIGTIQKIYGEEAAVEIELDSLPEAVALRHIEMQERRKTQWLDSVSEEARNRLTEKERDFRLRYTALVTLKDLTPPGKKPVTAAPSSRLTSADLEAHEAAELARHRNGHDES